MGIASFLLFLQGGVALANAGKAAFLIIDVQDCFLEAQTTSGKPGTLPVNASQIIPVINKIRAEKSCLFDSVVLTRDYHPANHISFASTHGLPAFADLAGKGGLPLTCLRTASGTTLDSACCPTQHLNPSLVNCSAELCPPQGWSWALNNSLFIQGNKACTQCKENPASCFQPPPQRMWPDHCLQNGDSTFPPSLSKLNTDTIVQLGANQYVDAYSAFMDNAEVLKTPLDATLTSLGVDTIYVAGIATDVCVKWTVKDALAKLLNKGSGYKVRVISDATAGLTTQSHDEALAWMQGQGATIVSSAEVLATQCQSPSPPPPPPPVSSGKAALVVVDVQDCFLEAQTTSGKPGTLAVTASHIIPVINKIRAEKSCLFNSVVLTQDYHPANHISFASTHGLPPLADLAGNGGLPLTCIRTTSGSTLDSACCPTQYLNPSEVDCSKQLCPPANWNWKVNNSLFIEGNRACVQCKEDPGSCFQPPGQRMWPEHCLQNGDSTFPPSLTRLNTDIIVQLGVNQFVDAYSAFMDNAKVLKTRLDATLISLGVDTIYVTGIATDVCVKETVKDALALLLNKGSGYNVRVISDATAGLTTQHHDQALAWMKGQGATIVSSAEVLAMQCPSSPSPGVSGGPNAVAVVLIILGIIAALAAAAGGFYFWSRRKVALEQRDLRSNMEMGAVRA